MNELNQDEIRQAVRQQYGKIAQTRGGCGCSADTSVASPESVSRTLGYSTAETGAVPEGANMGLGCGNPQAIAALKEGEVVLDLGSGGGFDCFLAARQVGPQGRVIGVDMTPEMISKARANAAKGGFANVEFRLGEIENLPVADNSVNAVISNCVINLSPNKPRVFAEAFRALKPGGRLAISDVVASTELPDTIKSDLALHTGCMAGAAPVAEIETMLKDCGFEQIRISPKDESRSFIKSWAPGTRIEDFVLSVTLEAIKPA